MVISNNQPKVLEYLANNPDCKSEQIAAALDMKKSKVVGILFTLKYKHKVKKVGDVWSIDDSPIPIVEKPVEEPFTPSNSEDLSTASQPEQVVEEPVKDEVKEEQIVQELQHKGLNAKISDIETKLDLALGAKQKKERKFRLPKFNKNKIKRFNKAKGRAVIMMSTNQNARLIKGEYMMGMIRVGENYYDGAALYTWLWEGKQPVYFIPEWSIRPLSASEIYQKATEDKTLINSQVITLRAMNMIEQDQDDAGKKKPNMMLFIGIGIVAVVVAFLLFGGKK